MASELERQLRAKPKNYVLKPNPAAKAEVWKNFSLIYERNVDGDDESNNESELKYH